MNKNIETKLKTMPHEPGCYIWKDVRGSILYIGKAKDLYKRTRQYFTNPHNYRIQKMVSMIDDMDYIVVENEKESLLLEQTLIKKHLPPFNVKITDDSRYPYIHITKELHPKLITVRKVSKTGKFYGPLPDGHKARDIRNLLNRVFPFRKCTPPKNPKKGDQCLYYHMGQCLACAPKEEQDTEIYKSLKRKVDGFFKGEVKTLMEETKDKEIASAMQLDFESAQVYKELQEAIQNTIKEQSVFLMDRSSVDVVGYKERDGYLGVTIFTYNRGKLEAKNEIVTPIYQEAEDAVTSYLGQYYSENNKPRELLVPRSLDASSVADSMEFKWRAPQRGVNADIVSLACKNAENALNQKFLRAQREHAITNGAIEELGTLLNIPAPTTIEIFDNSNSQGESAVSGMVVFKNGVPSKSDYRKYAIKYVEGPNDYASMEEVTYRRYFRLMRESKPLPNLIVVDGGKPQVSATLKTLNDLMLDIPVIGLGKDAKHKTSYIMKANMEQIDIDKKSSLFFLLTRMQDEVHRYALTFHRQKRAKSLIKSALEDISGLGPNRQNILMKELKTVSEIKKSSIEKLSKYIPRSVALNVYNHFNKKEGKSND